MSYLNQVKSELEQLQIEMKEKASIALSNIFEHYPEVTAISWHQYIPYFNDGDACTFRIGEVFVMTGPITKELAQTIADNPYAVEEQEEDEWPNDVQVLETWGDGKSESASEISSFLNSIEDTIQALYGDYASVVLTRDHGTIIEEFEAPY